MTAGQALRDQGTADVLAADMAPQRMTADLIRGAVGAVAAAGGTFSADDVQRLLNLTSGYQPHSPNLLPAVMSGMSKQGLIRPVGYTQSARPSRHAAVIRIWTAAT